MAEKKKGFDIGAAIGAVSKLGTGNRPQLEYIDIDRIDPDPKNRPVEGIDKLAQNIALVGLQQPLAVRADPEQEGRYVAISGHRRRLALKQLVEEGEERFRAVPCLVAPPGMSDAMVRLMLLSGNLVTQGLTPAQMAEATQELEDAIYKLKEEGHEFPGKVRDYVAETCGIASSRVGRLKKIREGLSPHWAPHFASGNLAESAAYVLAGLDPHLQEQTYWMLTAGETIPVNHLTAAKFEAVAAISGIIMDADAATCEELGGKRCSRAAVRMDSIILEGQSARCGGCCKDCALIDRCPHVCAPAEAFAREQRDQTAAARKADREQEAARERERKAQKEKAQRFALDCWKRMGTALERAGKSALWLDEAMGWDSDEDVDLSALLDRGEVTDDNKYYAEDGPLEGSAVEDVVSLADELGVSLDYLFCRTDEPGMARKTVIPAEVSPDEKPRWQTGDPYRSGRYYCLVECEGAKLSMTLRWVDGLLRWSMAGGGWLAEGCKVIGWWPLPDKDEAGDVLGAEE